MKKKKLLLGLAAFALTSLALTGCDNGQVGTNPTEETYNVRVGVHQNFGSAIGVLAETQGYYAEENVVANIQTTTGPLVIQGLQTNTLDIGFLGNGVSWNYFTKDSDIKLVAIDNLTNDDRLIARGGGKGDGLTEESTNEELRNALKGASVAVDLGATPGTFLKNLVTKLNEGLNDEDSIWFRDSANNANFPELDTYTKANEITIVQTSNANITAAMSSGAQSPDFCVCFAPVWGELIDDTTNEFVQVATTVGRGLPVTPSNWAVRTAWIEENPEAYRATMRALVKAMDYRANHQEESCTAVGNYIRMDPKDLMATLDASYFPTVEDQYEWLLDGTAIGYVEDIRNSHFGAGHDPVKTSYQAVDFSGLLEGCAAFLN